MTTFAPSSFRALGLALLAGLALVSCRTVPAPEDIPEGLSQAEMFQRAQEAVDEENWEAALVYYETFLERFPNDNANRAAAKYEVAFIYYRTGDLAAAEELFEALLQDYEDPALAPELPQWPRILATKLLAMIEEERNEAVEDES
jgi:outer membrane protein assembly factor BamD (BamD/ComL family)